MDKSAKSKPFSPEEIEKLEGTSSTFTLPDGRKLGYAQYGAQTSRTVFYCHGLPGSRIEAAGLVPMALRLDIRIVGVDRPGYGLSSPQPGRTLLDYAKDIECLAEFIGVDSYGVLVRLHQELDPCSRFALTFSPGYLRRRSLCARLRRRAPFPESQKRLGRLRDRLTRHEQEGNELVLLGWTHFRICLLPRALPVVDHPRTRRAATAQ
jgi:hypothetical protein